MKLTGYRIQNSLKISGISSKSSCTSPHDTSKQIRSMTPFNKHKCNPKDTKLFHVQLHGPSFEFGSSPRFEKLFVPVTKHKPTLVQVIEINKRIKKNKINCSVSPTERSTLTKMKQHKFTVRAQVTKIARNCIFTLKKEKFQDSLNEKSRKFSLRLKMNDFNKLARIWGVLTELGGISFCMKKIIQNRKRLKLRNSKRIMWIRSLCRAVGKIRILLRKIRAKRSIIKLRYTFSPILKIWIRAKHIKRRTELANYIENSISESGLCKVIRMINEKLRFIQRNMRICLNYKRIMYKKLLKEWEQVESAIYMKGKKAVKKQLQDDDFREKASRFSVPTDVKVIYIRRFFKEKFKNFLKVLNTFIVECKEIDQTNEENKWDILNHNIVLPYPVRPFFPLFLCLFSHSTISDLRKLALKNRTSWDYLQEQEKSKLEKSFNSYLTKPE